MNATATAPSPTVELAFTGRLRQLTDAQRLRLFDRSTARDPEVRERVAAIVAAVRQRGDAALRELAQELDGAELESLEVPRSRWRIALDALPPDARRALQRARDNIERAHLASLPVDSDVETEPGVVVGVRHDAVRRAGVYAPGGSAAYASSVLMGVVPAVVAGVPEVVVCSPPGRNGLPADVVLAAAELAGATRLFAIGGAGAIAAMAFGTDSVPAVERIVGPGNAYVAEAKLQLAGMVAFDAPAGPSELLVLADDSASPARVALEVLAQAEHDPRAAVVVVTLSSRQAHAVLAEITHALDAAARGPIVVASLAANGGVLVAESLAEALQFATEFAPEHLLLDVADPSRVAASVRNAGAVFLGESSSVVFGDYLTGANHVLPTGGAARAWSGLSSADFFRRTSWQQVTPAAAIGLAHDAAILAGAEGLPAHAAAAHAFLTESRSASGSAPWNVSDNTNLFGVPPAGVREMRRFANASLRDYPSIEGAALRRAVADTVGCDPNCVVTAGGSDQLLDMAFRAFSGVYATIAYPDPTFSMIPVFARWSGLRPIPCGLRPGGQADADALIAARADVTYLCSPNNPTGIAFSADMVWRIVNQASGVVILDEAYAEYANQSHVALALERSNLLVVRTMSKAYGLAGLRIGYAIGSAELLARVAQWRAPFALSAVADRVGATVLREDGEWMRACVARTTQMRERMRRELAAIGLTCLPSDANFVLVPVCGAGALARRLAARGVLVRVFQNLPCDCDLLRATNGDAIRITIGPWELMSAVLVALAAEREDARCA